MRRVKERIIEGSGGVKRERGSSLLQGGRRKCTAGCDGKVRVELWGMEKGSHRKLQCAGWERFWVEFCVLMATL